MNFLSTLRTAAQAILTNKLRSFLTMLGVIIGVGSVILLISIGTGLQQFIEGQFEDLGANTILILPIQVFDESGQFSNRDDRGSLGSKQLSVEMVRDIRRFRETVKLVLPESTKNTKVVAQGNQKSVSVLGTTADYATVRNTQTTKGRFFTPEEDRAGERVAVLGFAVAEKLFGKVDPVGKKLRVNGLAFEVVGVAEEKGGGFGGPTWDEYVFIPLEAFFTVFDTKDVNSISVQVHNRDQIPQTVALLDKYMLEKQNRDEDEFDVFDQRQILNTVSQILGILTLGLGGIAAISLVVGGIGIMNIMLVSVTERTREIGLRKALGATPNTILLQFLIESSLLSLLGGAIGVFIAFLFSLLLKFGLDFPSAITPGAILLAVSVSIAVGVVFGVAPARKASRLSPIEALRSE